MDPRPLRKSQVFCLLIGDHHNYVPHTEMGVSSPYDALGTSCTVADPDHSPRGLYQFKPILSPQRWPLNQDEYSHLPPSSLHFPFPEAAVAYSLVGRFSASTSSCHSTLLAIQPRSSSHSLQSSLPNSWAKRPSSSKTTKQSPPNKVSHLMPILKPHPQTLPCPSLPTNAPNQSPHPTTLINICSSSPPTLWPG